uniref:Sorting nexin-14 n=1 Tax=Syphacia muris TaxID=451379 RepID=A0A0N5AGE4_9BILA
MDFLYDTMCQFRTLQICAAFSVAVILLLQLSSLTLGLVVIGSALGYCSAALLFSYDNERLFGGINLWFHKNKSSKPYSNQSFSRNLNIKTVCAVPWEGVYIPQSVNDALEELIEQVLDNYVNNWYKNEINGKPTFVNEVKYHIRYAVSSIFKRISEVNLTEFILSEIVPAVIIHCTKIIGQEASIDKKILTKHIIETKVLESLDDLHYSLSSRENEVDYLRHLSELLINTYVDESRVAGYSSDHDCPAVKQQWPSRVCYHFLRELITFSMLLPFLDLIANPDTINRILISLLSPEPLALDQHLTTKNVCFLHGLTECESADSSESLLQLKLSEVLRDNLSFQMFSMYLKDVHGPLNELFFLLHSGSKDDDNALSEIRYDSWEIFQKYVHEGAQDRVALPSSIFFDFKKAIEKQDTELLDHTLEKAFQFVYRHLQRDYLLPFCQSDCYLGHICGSPPVSVEDLIATEQYNVTDNRSTIFESTFSFSQFRRKLWKVFTPSSIDGSENISICNDALNNVSVTEANMDIDNDAVLAVKPLKNETTALSPATSSNSDDSNVEGHIRSIPYDLPLFNIERDMNRWVVTIPHIDSRRDPSTGKIMFVYVVSVERFDLADNGTLNNDNVNGRSESILNKWSVIRRYNEFHILESKLLEFHGVLLKTQPLPPRKPFSKKSKEFIESHRIPFQQFLQLLTQQSLLKKSDLLFAFLTSDQEFKDNIQLSGLNPWNFVIVIWSFKIFLLFSVVRKVPSKFSRERGQNLRPFLLSLLANTLASHTKTGTVLPSGDALDQKYFLKDLFLNDEETVSRPRLLLINSIFSTGHLKMRPDSWLCSNSNQFWTKSVAYAVLFLLNKVYCIVDWLFILLCSVHSVVHALIDFYAKIVVQKIIKNALLEANCVRFIQLIQTSLFCCSPSSTEQEMVLRSELALRRALDYLEEEIPAIFIRAVGHKNFRQGTTSVFRVFQYPRLNKQLSYILLDIIVQRLIDIPEMKH